MAKKNNRTTKNPNILFGSEPNAGEVADTSLEKEKRNKKNFLSGVGRGEQLAAIGLCLLLTVGAWGAGWRETFSSIFSFDDSNQSAAQSNNSTGERDSIFSRLNPFAAPVVTATPQLSKEYIYAGSRLLAVEDAAAPNGTPTSGAGWEADAAARPNGDGLVQSNDVIQVQRFSIGLDQPYQTNEFQRADSAPRTSSGDGAINSADIIQTQRYQIGLDALHSADGPSAPISGATLGGQQLGGGEQTTEPRQLRVQSTTANAGQTVQVNLLTDALGDEAAYDFALTYDSAVLQTPAVVIGTAGGARTCNVPAAGHINCSIKDFPTDRGGSTDQIGEIAAGNNQVLARVTFTVAANAAAGATALALPSINVVNDAAQLLPVSMQSGAITITSAATDYIGYLDIANCTTITGWATDRNRLNTSIDVKIYDGATLLATLSANQLRSDVGAYLGDNGLHGYGITTPASLKDGAAHVIRVKFESSSAEVNNSAQSITCTPTATPTPTPVSATPTPTSTVTPTPTPGVRTNVALASNGGTASASSYFVSTYTYSAATAIDGSRYWAIDAGWKDATADSYPDWLQVDFSSSRTINEIDVVTLQDDYLNYDVVPTETTTFSLYGITNFEVQYWNGSGWATVPGGSVTNNNLVWKKLQFASVTTTKIRVTVNNAQANYSRIVELEAWTDGTTGQAAFSTNDLSAAYQTTADSFIEALAKRLWFNGSDR